MYSLETAQVHIEEWKRGQKERRVWKKQGEECETKEAKQKIERSDNYSESLSNSEEKKNSLERK